jgi:uncharacterized protein YfaP (DUF2135 family)
MYYVKTAFFLFLSVLLFSGCKKDDDDNGPRLVGQPGNPRFNLQFTNEANVDLDLHVEDPLGEEIYYGNSFSNSDGELDVDCLCDDCPQGANENIFWEVGKAPKGTYRVWVEYFDYCGNNANVTSNYTLRVVQNERIIATYTGTLSPTSRQSAVYIHNQN